MQCCLWRWHYGTDKKGQLKLWCSCQQISEGLSYRYGLLAREMDTTWRRLGDDVLFINVDEWSSKTKQKWLWSEETRDTEITGYLCAERHWGKQSSFGSWSSARRDDKNSRTQASGIVLLISWSLQYGDFPRIASQNLPPSKSENCHIAKFVKLSSVTESMIMT